MTWGNFTTGFLALILAGSLGAVLWRAPGLAAGYAPAPVHWSEQARTAVLVKEHALAHAWGAIRAENGVAAADWAGRSLQAGPQNAYAWLALAWGRELSGDETARATLDRSYALAPKSMALAQSRAALAQRWWPEMTGAARRRLLDEIRIARGLDAHAFNELARQIPRLAILHQLARP